MAAFSFYPSKNLGGFGDGGMVTTNEPRACPANRPASRARDGAQVSSPRGRLQLAARRASGGGAPGQAPPSRCLDQTCAGRSPTATAAFSAHAVWKNWSCLPVERPGNFHVYNQYRHSRAGDRFATRSAITCRRRKIGTEIYYPIPLHLQVCFASLGHREGDFPVSEAAARETIALPIYPELTVAEQSHVVSSIRQFMKEFAYPARTTDRAA